MTGKLNLPDIDKLGPVDFSAFPYTGAEDHIAKLTHQIQLDLAKAREDGLRAGLAAQGHGALVAEIDRLRASEATLLRLLTSLVRALDACDSDNLYPSQVMRLDEARGHLGKQGLL